MYCNTDRDTRELESMTGAPCAGAVVHVCYWDRWWWMILHRCLRILSSEAHPPHPLPRSLSIEFEIEIIGERQVSNPELIFSPKHTIDEMDRKPARSRVW